MPGPSTAGTGGESPTAFLRPPTQEQIQAAAYILMRSWAPSVLLPGDQGYDEQADDYDETGGCQCAGVDEYDDERGCNCGAGCTCDGCRYDEYAQRKRCAAGPVSVGTHCREDARYQVVAYRMQQQYLQEPAARAACPHPDGTVHHCTESTVYLETGLQPTVYWQQSACSVPHAQALIDAYQKERKDGPQYYIERFTYVPHDTELPEHLAVLRDTTQHAAAVVDLAVGALARGRDTADWLRYAREHLARAAWQAAHPAEDAPQEEAKNEPDGPPPVQAPGPSPWFAAPPVAEQAVPEPAAGPGA